MTGAVTLESVPQERPGPTYRRRSMGLVLCVALLAAAAVLSLAVGTKGIHPADVVRAFLAFDGSTDHLVVRDEGLSVAPVTVAAASRGTAASVRPEPQL